MISGKFRFHGYSALKFLFGHGKTFRFKSLSLRVVANPRRVHSRVAIVISKKVFKAAPKRNRVRRRVYEVIRTHWDNILPAHDIVITIFDPALLDAPHTQVVAEITEALQSAGLWTDTKNESPQQ